MTVFIYSRVSTDKQETVNQLEELKRRYPDATVIEEKASGAKQRPELESLLSKMQKGDTIAVAALDRLGRKSSELVLLLEDLVPRGITLVSIREGIDFGTMMGQFVGTIFAAMATMERRMISERTRNALKAKQAAGKILGRPKTFDLGVYERMKTLAASGAGVRDIARQTGVSASQVSRFLKKTAS